MLVAEASWPRLSLDGISQSSILCGSDLKSYGISLRKVDVLLLTNSYHQILIYCIAGHMLVFVEDRCFVYFFLILTHTANVLSAEYTDVCLRSKFKNKH